MPDKKANKNYNISITDKEEIVKESISEITKQISEKIELVSKQIFENVNKQYQEEIMALKLEITQLKESQDFLSNKYDELKTEFKQLNVINSKQEKELCNLKKNSIELKNNANHKREKFDNLEQYGRRQNLEFVGIPYEKNENLNQIVSDLAEKIGVPIKDEDIFIAHRLKASQNAKPEKPPNVIVRFTNQRIRNKIYQSRSAAKSINNFPVQQMTRFFINENLTNAKKELFWQTKERARELGYHYIWTNNGKIYIRKGQEYDSIIINNESDINKL